MPGPAAGPAIGPGLQPAQVCSHAMQTYLGTQCMYWPLCPPPAVGYTSHEQFQIAKTNAQASVEVLVRAFIDRTVNPQTLEGQRAMRDRVYDLRQTSERTRQVLKNLTMCEGDCLHPWARGLNEQILLVVRLEIDEFMRQPVVLAMLRHENNQMTEWRVIRSDRGVLYTRDANPMYTNAMKTQIALAVDLLVDRRCDELQAASFVKFQIPETVFFSLSQAHQTFVTLASMLHDRLGGASPGHCLNADCLQIICCYIFQSFEVTALKTLPRSTDFLPGST